LLSWEKNAGLRQSYFLNKRLRFSRLTPLNPGSSFGDAIATEAARTHQYLHSLSLTPPGEMLKVHIICHADDKSVLNTVAERRQHAVLLPGHSGTGARQARDSFADSDATALFLHLLAAKPPRSQYASSVHTHYYLLWQIRHLLFGMAALTAFVCLAWSALLINEGRTLEAESAPISTQISRMHNETQQILQSFPNTSVPAADMKSAVTLLRQLHNYSARPQELLDGLASALDHFPRIRTRQISWKTSATAEGGAANAPAQVITFNGELSEFGNDYRGQLNYLENFQHALTLSGYAVSVSRMPLDVSSKGSISADVSEATSSRRVFAATCGGIKNELLQSDLPHALEPADFPVVRPWAPVRFTSARISDSAQRTNRATTAHEARSKLMPPAMTVTTCLSTPPSTRPGSSTKSSATSRDST
jgi:hypothetical protein